MFKFVDDADLFQLLKIEGKYAERQVKLVEGSDIEQIKAEMLKERNSLFLEASATAERIVEWLFSNTSHPLNVCLHIANQLFLDNFIFLSPESSPHFSLTI